jgi:glycosyltransferase involved in cell wall biosynthesis
MIWAHLQAYRYQLVKPEVKAWGKRVRLVAAMKRASRYCEMATSASAFRDLEKQRRAARIVPPGIPGAEFCALHGLEEEDYGYFHGAALDWLPLFKRYDVIQAYSTDPIWPFLCQLPNYVAYEHGTIREIPFQDTNIGRMTAAAYKAAPAVFITNVDNIRGADRLGLKAEQRFYLPHAFDYRKLLRHQAGSAIRFDTRVKPQIFMPSRQDWVVRDPNWAKGNDLVIRAVKLLAERGVDCTVKFVEWGKDVAASRALIAELGVEDRIEWSPLLTKRALWDEYLGSAAVIDQFLLPGISGVSFEAMTLGVPVITCDEPGLNATFFGRAPPLLTANSAEEVAERIERVVKDPAWRNRQAQESARWIVDYHSSERIFEIQVNAFRKLIDSRPPA